MTSHHHATNNAVLIAKLRAGFVISGIEINDQFGVLVNLTYFLDADRRAAFGERVARSTIENAETPTARQPDSRTAGQPDVIRGLLLRLYNPGHGAIMLLCGSACVGFAYVAVKWLAGLIAPALWATAIAIAVAAVTALMVLQLIWRHWDDWMHGD